MNEQFLKKEASKVIDFNSPIDNFDLDKKYPKKKKCKTQG